MVNIAQLKIAKPPDILCALGLGSCVGVVLYDPISNVAGMLHVLLPSEMEAGEAAQVTRTKFANPGIQLLRDEVVKAGAVKSRLRAKLAGGAAVLMTNSQGIAVGQRNGEECLHMLKELNIPVEGVDLGGTSGRSVYFEPGTKIMRIKKLVGGESQL